MLDIVDPLIKENPMFKRRLRLDTLIMLFITAGIAGAAFAVGRVSQRSL